jgi:short-subunit dehydrogenase
MSTALILGARSDIAQALAHRFARAGFDLILAARSADSLAAAVSDLELRYAVKASAVEFDATATDSHPAFYAALQPKPDVTLCVFGYLGDADLARKDFGEAERILTTNFTGAASILGVVAEDYEQKRAGTIVGIASVAGDRGRQSNYHYGSAKAGFAAFLSGLRNRLTPAGAHVLTVKPGFVATQMTEGMDLPPALTASPENVAHDVFNAFQKRKNVIYTRWMWRWIMLIIRSIPEPIFKKLGM